MVFQSFLFHSFLLPSTTLGTLNVKIFWYYTYNWYYYENVVLLKVQQKVLTCVFCIST